MMKFLDRFTIRQVVFGVMAIGFVLEILGFLSWYLLNPVSFKAIMKW